MNIRFLWTVSVIYILGFIHCSGPINAPAHLYLEETFASTAYQAHDDFKISSIQNRRFKHGQIQQLMDSLSSDFIVTPLGTSFEGKPIRMVSFGKGRTQVLLWSQMHGNEPTATMALMDLLAFFSTSDTLDTVRKLIANKLTVHFIPMLNPDGSDQFERRNAQGVDINRDALRLCTPEGQILKKVRDSLKADWGFNLHDQNRSVSVGRNPAAISFLAPEANAQGRLVPNQIQAMKLIGLMHGVVEQYIPNHTGRYWDDYEPRAFGDNMQRWGTSTILIETGGLRGDREKQELRRVNFTLLLVALKAIAQQTYKNIQLEAYQAIPENKNDFHDVLVRNIRFPNPKGDPFIIDLAYRFKEVENKLKSDYMLEAAISDDGDLSFVNGYVEFDAEGFDVAYGKRYKKIVEDASMVASLDPIGLLRKGITDWQVKKTGYDPLKHFLPVRFISQWADDSLPLPHPGQNPSLIFSKQGVPAYVLVNGFVIDLSLTDDEIIESLKKY